MTELRRRMLDELQGCNFAPSTIRYYIRTVRDFAAYFHKSPDLLGVEEVRQFQLHMLRDGKLATGTRNRMTALHFFFKKVLRRYDPELYDMKLTRVPKKLPVVLSPEEVEKLIATAPNLRYRMILVFLYATGLRRAEASQLKIADIDSQRMIIHVMRARTHAIANCHSHRSCSKRCERTGEPNSCPAFKHVLRSALPAAPSRNQCQSISDGLKRHRSRECERLPSSRCI